MHVKYLTCMACMPICGHISFRHVFVEVTVGCILVYLCKNIGFICPYSMLAMWAIFGMWQPYLFSDICQMCTVLLVTSLMSVTLHVAYICTYILHICKSCIWHIWHICPICGHICFRQVWQWHGKKKIWLVVFWHIHTKILVHIPS